MRELTGRKVFAIFAAAFGTIIAVNVFMAAMAIGTFPGLEVRNSYVASQSFDAERAAQKALGWTLAAVYEDGALTLRFRDAGGLPVAVTRLGATIGRPTMAGADIQPEFTHALGAYSAPMQLGPGKWMLLLEAFAADGTRFHQRIDLFVKG